MRTFAALAFALLAPACSASAPPVSSGSQGYTVEDGGACRYPPGLPLSSGVVSGACAAHPPARLCQEGTAEAADGAVTVGSGACQSICPASEYELTCSGSEPDPALGCTAIVMPTPACCAYYCCPCR